MQKITPSLWFDKNLKEITDFYTSCFGDVEVGKVTVMNNTPSGMVEIASVRILDSQFTMMTAGPLFKFTPAISFMVACKTAEEVDALWNKLIDGGKAMMELASYPFSERYGWLADKHGLTWQIMSTGGKEPEQRITPSLMFVGDVYGKVEEAIDFYASVFKNTNEGFVMKYEKDETPHDKEGAVKYAAFTLEGQQFAAMESGYTHEFTFNEAVSFEVRCEDQAEIDYYWEKLSAHPESEQCGWVKDKYGVSWQIVPKEMDSFMQASDQEGVDRVMQELLKMKKIDIQKLREAARS